MYVIRLPDGTLRVPHSVLADTGGHGDETGDEAREGRIIADAYVEIGPDDPDYDRLLDESLTEEELEDRRRRWRDEDAELLRRFEEWKAGDRED
ncbi:MULTISPECIES: hypothetical protein [Actinomadura]|uniref:Uncharacterized protein n=1 Tax=Actinomadura madurae TaxID=1993 RepID=A0A1I5EHF0_9ACTN|nr:hypothetical protein [Actinomadura madurae]MCP9952853.1 hypothetical protein [Actinomadura madurae]MCP9969619.1 hypothetical protein [Actinomadura madurae]MCP9982075.1 hypothetical protein [Actinomadura madurae]MCQ0006401.1 hypothetical protein [Actinomadura madurae]MCQ0018311.1 hypothetical protein [Actinomadura madurae]